MKLPAIIRDALSWNQDRIDLYTNEKELDSESNTAGLGYGQLPLLGQLHSAIHFETDPVRAGFSKNVFLSHP
jgi:hypothetical protein